jgi:hypothetical protein
LLLSSEIIIEPGKSKTYWRLLLVAYVFTLFLIIYSSIFLFIKLLLIVFTGIFLRSDWRNQNPCSEMKKIQFIANEWILERHNGEKKTFTQANILISNILFHLIQFKNPKHTKLIVLFHDQTTNHQLRLLYLKMSQK